MRVIQISMDIAVDALTDVEELKKALVDAISFSPIRVMGIEQSDTSWTLEEYVNKFIGGE